jgi:predicted deacylase
LPYVLTVSRPVQPAKGLSSYAAAAEKGVPAILAEAGGVGQLQEDAVELLVSGVKRVMRHTGMLNEVAKRMPVRLGPAAETPAATILTSFEWLYSKHAGMWYPRVAAGDFVENGQEIGTIGDLFGDTLETIISPVSGIVLFLTINPSVQQNGLLMGIGVQ